MAEYYDRARLQEEVWSAPLREVAPGYGLSDVGLKKLCARLQIPTPGRGYWAKLKAGKRVPARPELREYTGPRGALLKPTRAAAVPSSSPSSEPVDPRLQAILSYEQDPAHNVRVAERLSRPHPLVVKTRDALKKPAHDQRGIPLPTEPALDLKVSTALLPRALRVADALLKALEQRGYRVTLDGRFVQVEILGISSSLSFFEPTRRTRYVPSPEEIAKQARGQWVYLPQWQYTPSGQLHVIADQGYSGKVVDTAKIPVEDQLNAFILYMARRAVQALLAREQRAIQEAELRRRREEALARKALQDAERERLQQVESDAQDWMRAEQLRDYLSAFEQHALWAGGLTEEQRAFLVWGRAKADWLDPLVVAGDELLDQEIEIPSPSGYGRW
ncbi:hypothetical protein KRX52_06215 [Pseudomonas sp. MAP12]|uniref:Uncharacterized protein n=1 Tax=Geopseudomonas aromaticivorans TaxID=2849492 RepID=A0ABS6MUB1_9GAMM|nr:hypothetical protein [Pseudomonas aromaticivorans]MBV2132396.1 hypothetical protein [Pseudomonas aromaticivorans]